MPFVLASCVEKRIISVRGPANLPGAIGGTRPDVATAPVQKTWEEVLGESLPKIEGTPVEGKPLRFITADKKIVLQSYSPRQMMIHLDETLRAGEDDLLYTQVLSDELKNAYRSRGMDPHESVIFLKENADGVYRFLSLLPLGEQTPGVMMRNIRRNTYRIETLGGGSEGQTFRSIDVIFERGGFRLLLLN